MIHFFAHHKKHLFNGLLLLCTYVTAVAQTSKIDDLLAQLKPNDPDTVQIKVLRKLSAAYTSVDPTKKFYYANLYLQLAEKNNIDSTIADAYLDMGISYGIKSKLDSALHYFKLGQNIAKANNYNSGIARSYVNIGFVYDRTDKKQEAVACYENALKIYKNLNHRKGINQCIINLGSIYFDLKEYKSADNYFEQVLENLLKNPTDDLSLGNAYYSLGGSKRRLLAFDKSMDYYRKSLAIREKIGDINGIALSNWGISQLYVEKKDYKRALDYLNVAINNNRKLSNAYQECAMLITLTEAHLGLKDYQKADEAATLALAKAKETNAKIPVSLALDNISKVKAKKNEYESALSFKSQYIAVNDSLENSKTTKEVILNDLHRINTDIKNLEERNQTISAKITDYIIVIAIITGLLVLVVILLALYYKRNTEKKNANILLQEQKRQVASVNEELSALNEELKTQMEIVSNQNIELEKLNNVKNKFFSIVSHDLRAPIHSLKALFGMYRSGILNEEELSNLLAKLEDTVYNTASFLDNLLEWSKSQLEGMVVKPGEVNLSQVTAHNIKLMESQIKMKFIKVENKIASNLFVHADPNMVHVVFRNLLSNAIKFCSKGDEVTFETKAEGDSVICTIKDTGPGINDIDKKNLFNLTHQPGTGTAGEKGHHIGLILCKDMILQNNGNLQVESKLGEGTTFFITLPMQLQ
jgi:signal transduction histidine kinase